MSRVGNACVAVLLAAAALPAQKMPLAAGDPRLLQLHDVRDLVREPAAEADGKEEAPAVPGERQRAELDQLAHFVRAFADPPLLPDEEVRALGPDHLVMLARPERQAWLEQLLVRHREAGAVAILLEICVLEVPQPAFAEHFAPLVEGRDVVWPLQVVRAPGEATDRWGARVVADPRVEVVTAPRLLALPLRHATICIGASLRYVKDYEVEILDRGPVAKPIMADLFDGTRIETTCGLAAAKGIVVRFDLEHSDVAKPIPQHETAIAGSETKITIDQPVVERVTLRQTLVLPDGGCAVVAAAPANGRHRAAIVRARLQPR